MKGIKLVEIRSEIGAGTRGASLGIDALRVASLNAGSDFFNRYKCEKVKDQNHLLFEAIKTPSAPRIEGVRKVYEDLSKVVKSCLDEGYFPLILGADHASAGGTIAALKMKYPEKRIGVIWIDAHGDLHSPYTSPSGNVHGMPLATALNEDNLENKVKEVEQAAIEQWNAMKNIGGIAPKILAEDLIFFGVRDTEGPEKALMKKHNIKNYTVEACRAEGVDVKVKAALTNLKKCDLLYISFDVDSLDSERVSAGTGTPVPNGFMPDEVNGIIQGIVSSGKLICFEMVEVNPTLDKKGNKMAETAFKILDKTAKSIEKHLD